MPDANALSLRVNFTWTFAGNITYAATQWGMLVVLAKLGTPEMVGQFALGLAITAPIIMFTNLSLRAVQSTDAKDLHQFGDYFALRIITTIGAILATIVVVWIVGYVGEAGWIILAIAIAKAVESLSDVFYGFFQKHEQMDYIARSMIIKGMLSLVALAIGVYVSGSVFGGVLGLIIVWTLVFVLYDIRNGRRLMGTIATGDLLSQVAKLRPNFDLQMMRRLAWLALPLGLAATMVSLRTTIPRYFIERHGGQYELGIFAVMAYFMVAGTTIANALGQATSPRLAQHYAAVRVSNFRNLLIGLILFGILLGVGGLLVVYLAGPFILTLLYQPEYAAHSDVLVWLAFGTALSYVATFLGFGMTATRNFRIQPVIIGTTTLLTLILSMLLIPNYGMVGAAWALAIAAGLTLLMALIVNVHAYLKLLGKANMGRGKTSQ